MGVDGFGMGLMLEAGMIASHIGSYVGENKLLETRVIAGQLDLTWYRKGPWRSAFARAVPAFPAFIPPPASELSWPTAKNCASSTGASYLLETALVADYALIKAWRGDRLGNLVYRKTARNFNPMMATAARITIAEVEELVEPGEIDPDHVITPGIYVTRLIQGEHYEKRIERRTVRKAF